MKRTDFTEGPVFMPLLRFMIPVMLSLFLQVLYGAVDLLVVGIFSDASNVAATGFGGQVMQLITTVITDLALGTTVVLGSLLGRRRMRLAGKTIGTTVSAFTILAIGLTLLFYFLAPPVCRALQVPEEAFPEAVSYIRICAAGLVFIVGYNVLGGIFRGTGNSLMPLFTVVVAAICNILGDLLLVGGFGMGASGAAWATIASQGISVLLSVLMIRHSGMPVEIHRSDFKVDMTLVYKMLSVGIPVAIQDVLVGISFLWIMGLVNGLGVDASAGIGIAEKLCGFIMLVPLSFLQSMSAFVAQNYGARRMDRAFLSLKYGIATSLSFGLVLAGISFFHGDFLAGFFTSDPPVREAAFEYLKAYGLDTLLTSFLFCFFGFYNGCEKTKFVMAQGMIGALFFRMPLSWLFSRLEPVTVFQIGLANPLSSIFQVSICTIYLFLMKRKLEERE